MICYILLLTASASCTSTRKLSKKFSEQPAVIKAQLSGTAYSNRPEELKTRYTIAHNSLWDKLAAYRLEKDTLPPVSGEAIIRLSLVTDTRLNVEAYQQQQLIAGFAIPVRKRGKYLILEKKRTMIPIPVIYFDVKEAITILAPLKNNRIGIHRYSDHTLWILFFGASNTGRSIEEYSQLNETE
ncbi:hypothetical protein [Parapedobacter pyrenivorans]|nr:hypothetical protein [Parapedobacter pyrenivorans]